MGDRLHRAGKWAEVKNFRGKNLAQSSRISPGETMGAENQSHLIRKPLTQRCNSAQVDTIAVTIDVKAHPTPKLAMPPGTNASSGCK